MMKQKIEKTADEKMWNRISQIPAVILVLLSGIDIVRFAILGDKTAFITFSMIAVTFMLVAYMAWKSKMPFLYLVIAAAAFVLYFNTNFSSSTIKPEHEASCFLNKGIGCNCFDYNFFEITIVDNFAVWCIYYKC